MIVGKVSPRRALIDFYALPVTLGLVALTLVKLGLFVATSNQPLIIAVFMASLFAILVAMHLERVENEFQYGNLVRRWKKVTNYPAVCFPINAVGCESLREKYFLAVLERKVRDANSWFDARGRDKNLLEQLKGGRPQYAVEQVNSPEAEFHGREAHAKTQKEYDAILTVEQRQHKQLEARAEAIHREYLTWWDLAKDLGKFYNVNLLPIWPTTNKCFDDPDKFRKHIAERDDLARTPPDPMYDR